MRSVRLVLFLSHQNIKIDVNNLSLLFDLADPPDAGCVRPARARAGLAGGGGAPARARAPRAPSAPCAALLHALCRKPRTIRFRA